MSLACLGAAVPLRVTEAAAAGSASIPFEKYCDLDAPPKGWVAPEIIGHTKIRYPQPVAGGLGEGLVILRLTIGADGDVKSAVAEDWIGDFRLVDSAIRSTKNWRFTPATFNGKPREYHSKYMGVDFYIMQLREDRPIDRMAYKRLSAARDAIRSKDFKRAIDQAEEILHSVSSYFELTAASYYLGLAQAGQKNWAEATFHLDHALRSDAEFLDEKQRIEGLQVRLVANQETGALVEGLCTAAELAVLTKESGDTEGDTAKYARLVREISAKIRTMEAMAARLTVFKEVSSGHAMSVPHTVTRRNFRFEDIQGQFTKFHLICSVLEIEGQVDLETEWDVPPEAGVCKVFLDGAVGASVNIVERGPPR